MTDTYNTSDTVRLTRQLAREVGCEATVQIFCFAESDTTYAGMEKILFEYNKAYPDYRLHRITDLSNTPAGIIPDAYVISTRLPNADTLAGSCGKNMPVIMFKPANGDAIAKLRFPCLNQTVSIKLDGTDTAKVDLSSSINRMLRCCSVMLH